MGTITAGRWRPLAGRVALVCAACGAALLLAEILCKTVDLLTTHRGRVVTRRISRPSDLPGVRYELIPRVESVTPGLRQKIRINNLGFRGPDVTVEKPQGVVRIVVLGDSIAFGRTYAEPETFPANLQARLDARYGRGRFEVINAALSGRDTWEERAILEHRVLPLCPDLVILQICMNDHIRLPPVPLDSRRGVFGERAWYQYSSLLALLDQRLRGFRSVHVAWVEWLGLDSRTPAEVLIDQVVSPASMLNVEPHWNAWSRELLAAAAAARSRGVGILWLAFPLHTTLEAGEKETLPALTALASAHDIPLLDMAGFFAGDPEANLRDYTHPSRRGHLVVAAELERVLVTFEGFWPSATATGAGPPGR